MIKLLLHTLSCSAWFDCGNKKTIAPSTIYSVKSIQCGCKDGNSYPEKFMKSLLNQLKIDYITQYSPQWVKPKRYDFYFKINDEEYIIETHGLQHYKYRGFSSLNSKTSEEEQENDEIKKELAIKNGIKPENYIVIDCRKSDLEWIKNSIIHSKLNEIFDLNDIDWVKIGQQCQKSIVKEVCDYWYLHNEINNENLKAKSIGILFDISRETIVRYLKRGTELDWCKYNPKEEMRKCAKESVKKSCKPIEIFKDGV